MMMTDIAKLCLCSVPIIHDHCVPGLAKASSGHAASLDRLHPAHLHACTGSCYVLIARAACHSKHGLEIAAGSCALLMFAKQINQLRPFSLGRL